MKDRQKSIGGFCRPCPNELGLVAKEPGWEKRFDAISLWMDAVMQGVSVEPDPEMDHTELPGKKESVIENVNHFINSL